MGSVLGMFLVQKLIRGGYNDESTNNQRLTREQKLTAMNKLEKVIFIGYGSTQSVGKRMSRKEK